MKKSRNLRRRVFSLKCEGVFLKASFKVGKDLEDPHIQLRLNMGVGDQRAEVQVRFIEGSVDETSVQSSFLALLYASSSSVHRRIPQPINDISRYSNFGDLMSFSGSLVEWLMVASALDNETVLISVIPTESSVLKTTQFEFLRQPFSRREVRKFAMDILLFFNEISRSTEKYTFLPDYALSENEGGDAWMIIWSPS